MFTTSLTSPLTLPLTRPLTGMASNPIIWSPAQLFQSGESGGWYDPSDLDTMFTTSTGITNVASDGDPVGLALDKAQFGGLSFAAFMAGQAELVINNNFDTVLTPWAGTNWVWESDGAGGGRVRHTPGATSNLYQAGILTIGAYYQITYTVGGVTSGSVTPRSGQEAGNARSANSVFTDILVAGTVNLEFRPTTDFDGYVDSISIKEIPGNHLTQSISASRPTYRTDGTYHWLEFDGVDDYLGYPTTNFGGATAYHAYGYDTDGDTVGIMLSIATEANPWVYIFQQGSSNTVLSAAGVTLNGLHVDGDTADISNRGTIYDAVSGKHVSIWAATFPSATYDWCIGNYSNSILLSGKLYSHVWRDQLTAAERGQLESYISEKSGVTL